MNCCCFCHHTIASDGYRLMPFGIGPVSGKTPFQSDTAVGRAYKTQKDGMTLYACLACVESFRNSERRAGVLAAR